MIWDRRKKNGYSDFGAIQIPPRPNPMVLTDRTTGLQWMLSFETNPDRISITQDLSALQKREGARVYDKDDGPAFDQDGEFTIFIDNGRLGVKYTPFPGHEVAFDNAPIYARQVNDQRAVNLDTLNVATLHIGFSE